MYDFPVLMVSDRSLRGIHTFWGRNSHSWWPILGMKQIEPPYLYGYGVRIKGRFVGICREREEARPLVRPLGEWNDPEVEPVWSGSESDSPSTTADSPQPQPS